jgi:hypothetical protein
VLVNLRKGNSRCYGGMEHALGIYVGGGYAMGTESRPHRDSLPPLGDNHASLGDCPSPLGDHRASQGDSLSPLGDYRASQGDSLSPLGDHHASQGDCPSPLGDHRASQGDYSSPLEESVSEQEENKNASANHGTKPLARPLTHFC